MKFGLFIELPNTVEGLVHISRMNDDYYQYVEQFMALVGRNTRRTYKMGQAIRVKVVNVDVKQSAVDFDIVDPEKTPQSNMLPKRTYHNNNYHGNNERMATRTIIPIPITPITIIVAETTTPTVTMDIGAIINIKQ